MMKNHWALVLLVTACGGKDVSFSTVEDARAQAKENGVLNAQAYRSENGLADFDIYPRGDSTIAPDCPNGDGWASNELRRKTDGKAIKLKCSTVSVALGCMTDEDFKSKPYAQDDGKCQPLNKVPHPIPKLAR